MPSPPPITRAVILAAGEGKRMRPLTANRPKVLLPVAGVPLAERLVRQLVAAGVTTITLVVHYKQDAVREHFGNGSAFGATVTYAVQEKPRGTGDALKAAGVREDALVLNGDLLLDDAAIGNVLASGEFALTGIRVEKPQEFGVFDVGTDGVVNAVVEKSQKPPSNIANAGLYRFPARFFRHLNALEPSVRGELELTDAVNAFLDECTATLVELPQWLDVGRPWDILKATEWALEGMKGQILGTVEDGCVLKGNVHVAKGAVLKSGTYIEGPVWIGEDAVVGPNCYIRPNTVVGRKCKVGNACEVKASVLMDGTHVGHLSYVGDSILGERVNFGAGTKVANLRHDGRNVKVTIEGKRYDTGRRKMGVIVGDDVHTGINTSLNVGVVLAAGSGTAPGQVVMGGPAPK